MSNNKQSSVEWLEEQIHCNLPCYNLLNFDQKFFFIELMKQAKQMHKEEVMEAYKYSRAHWSKEDGNPEQYFTKTFGGQDNE